MVCNRINNSDAGGTKNLQEYKQPVIVEEIREMDKTEAQAGKDDCVFVVFLLFEEMENISPEEAVYFGDDQDDLEPIRMCAMGVAVSNANEEVKAAADYVCGSNDEDGVDGFLEQKLLRTERE